MAAKIRCNDEIIVIAGKDKGKRGKVKKVLSNGRAIVEGINLVKQHQKPAPAIKKPGGIFEKEAAIDISNIAIFNIDSHKADRIGFMIKDGKKVRILKSNRKIVT